MKIGHKSLLAAFAVGASLLAGAALAQSLTPADIKAIVASPDRSAADRTNDQRRHPEEMLAFIGFKPGLIALDLSAGGGYTTELLARSIGPTGKVYGQSRPRPGHARADAAPPPRATPIRPPRRAPRRTAAGRAHRVPRRWRWPIARASSRPPTSPPRRSSQSCNRSRIRSRPSWPTASSIS